MDRFAEWVAKRTPVLAVRPDNMPVDSAYWDQFATGEEIKTVMKTLSDSNIAFSFSVDTKVRVLAGEDKIPALFTIAGVEMDFGQVAAVLWKDGVGIEGTAKVVDGWQQRGEPNFDANNVSPLRFTPKPPTPPAPRPDPGPTSGADLSNSSLIGDSGAFTAADRALLWRIAGKLGAL